MSCEVSRKMRALLRVRKFYSVAALIRLYKAHVLPYAERSIPAIFHAPPNSFACLDNVQVNVLNELQVSDKDALCDFNLAPLSTRRDVSMLVLLHRTQLGIAPPVLSSFFPMAKSTMFKFSVSSVPPHNRQIAYYVTPSSSIAFQRSIFGLVRVYNKLPAKIVAAPSASAFQRRLQALLKHRVKDGFLDWHCLFHAVQ